MVATFPRGCSTSAASPTSYPYRHRHPHPVAAAPALPCADTLARPSPHQPRVPTPPAGPCCTSDRSASVRPVLLGWTTPAVSVPEPAPEPAPAPIPLVDPLCCSVATAGSPASAARPASPASPATCNLQPAAARGACAPYPPAAARPPQLQVCCHAKEQKARQRNGLAAKLTYKSAPVTDPILLRSFFPPFPFPLTSLCSHPCSLPCAARRSQG